MITRDRRAPETNNRNVKYRTQQCGAVRCLLPGDHDNAERQTNDSSSGANITDLKTARALFPTGTGRPAFIPRGARRLRPPSKTSWNTIEITQPSSDRSSKKTLNTYYCVGKNGLCQALSTVLNIFHATPAIHTYVYIYICTYIFK